MEYTELYPHRFHAIDYAIFILVLFVSVGIGLYHACSGGKQQTTKEFLMADRRMNTLPVALSILVSFVSGILVLGTPAEMYTRGTQLFMRTFGYCIACVLSSVLFVPIFFNLKVTSSFEYLEMRFQSSLVKLFGTVSMLIGNIFYMGIVIYTPSTALEAVTGFPLWSSVIAMGCITTLYTTLGGLKAVIWTDVFQAIVMVSGILVILIKGLVNVGGIEKVWNMSSDGGRIIFFNFDFDPTQRLTFWSTVIGGTFSTLGIFGVGQANVQRYCSLPTLAQAKRSVYLNIPFLLIMNVLISLVGLVIYTHYTITGCDPIRSKAITSQNQLLPYYIVDAINFPGLPGIFVAVLFSGSLSSLSTSLNSAAAVTWQDIISKFAGRLSEAKKTFVTKLLVVLYGCTAMVVAYCTRLLGGHVLQASLSFSGATIGPSLGLFLLGALFPSANWIGAITGCALSSCFSLWLAIGTFIAKPHYQILPTSVEQCNTTLWNRSIVTDTWSSPTTAMSLSWNTENSTSLSSTHKMSGLNRMYEISFLWYSFIGCVLTVSIGLMVSFATRSCVKVKTDPLLYIPIFDRLYCCLSKRARRVANIGNKYIISAGWTTQNPRGSRDDGHSVDNSKKSASKSSEKNFLVGSENVKHIDDLQPNPPVNYHIYDVLSEPTIKQSVVLGNWDTLSTNSESPNCNLIDGADSSEQQKLQNNVNENQTNIDTDWTNDVARQTSVSASLTTRL